MYDMLGELSIFFIIFASLGVVELDSPYIIEEYIMWAKLQQPEQMGYDWYAPYRLWIVTEIDEGWCNAKNNNTVGCTKIPKLGETQMGVIQVLQDKQESKSYPGFNVYMHEYLHARCETYAPWANYHVSNNFPIWLGGHDYWNDCRPAGDVEDWIRNAPQLNFMYELGNFDPDNDWFN